MAFNTEKDLAPVDLPQGPELGSPCLWPDDECICLVEPLFPGWWVGDSAEWADVPPCSAEGLGYEIGEDEGGRGVLITW